MHLYHTLRTVAGAAFATAVLLVAGCRNTPPQVEEPQKEPVPLLYGIEYGRYRLEEGTVAAGQSFSVLLARYGLSASAIDRVAKSCAGEFDVRNVRAGHKYAAFLQPDSLGGGLAHFVYEKSLADYLVLSFGGDSVGVSHGSKQVRTERKMRSGRIESSLWSCMVREGLSLSLFAQMEDIFAWSVDFFALKPGDRFTVIYDEKYVDSLSIGAGRIWGAVFHHGGKDYYAIPFQQDGKVTYWDEQGNSMRKNLLKTPLKFTRISSRFSNSRLHPVLKIRRPHYGVDYAAPSGTPVHAVADGIITFKGWGGGGGNMLKIKHAQNLTSGYLHLRGYAKGIVQGKRVSQGDVIGYVGSTGTSTGPHLDFRLWKGSTPIDPLKAPNLPVEPIYAQNRDAFDVVRERVLAELRGELPDSLRIVRLDSIPVPAPLQDNAVNGLPSGEETASVHIWHADGEVDGSVNHVTTREHNKS